eukprot:scaffold240585_cov37-Tisochrysis_lutea.AAC.1
MKRRRTRREGSRGSSRAVVPPYSVSAPHARAPHAPARSRAADERRQASRLWPPRFPLSLCV